MQRIDAREGPTPVLGTKPRTRPATTGRTSAPPILYIDKQDLTRQIISEQLAIHLKGWFVRSAGTTLPLDEIWRHPGPRVVVVHGHEESSSGLELRETIGQIANMAPASPIVLMSALDNAKEVIGAFDIGVRGYLPTYLPAKLVGEAIRLVDAGGIYIPLSILPSVVHGKPTDPEMVNRANGAQFSPRQLQVIRNLQRGMQNKLIAHELKMCESTVKVHIRNIMKKLDARNRTQIVLKTQQFA